MENKHIVYIYEFIEHEWSWEDFAYVPSRFLESTSTNDKYTSINFGKLMSLNRTWGFYFSSVTDSKYFMPESLLTVLFRMMSKALHSSHFVSLGRTSVFHSELMRNWIHGVLCRQHVAAENNSFLSLVSLCL